MWGITVICMVWKICYLSEICVMRSPYISEKSEITYCESVFSQHKNDAVYSKFFYTDGCVLLYSMVHFGDRNTEI